MAAGRLQQSIQYRDGRVPSIEAVGFYEKCGFTRAGGCAAMWIYSGTDHN